MLDGRKNGIKGSTAQKRIYKKGETDFFQGEHGFPSLAIAKRDGLI